MRVEAAYAEGRLTLSLSGELDHHAAREIMREIEEQLELRLPGDCVLDLAGLTFMDSSGIAVLLKTYRRVCAFGGRLRAEHVRAQPLRVLRAAGIGRLIDVTAQS